MSLVTLPPPLGFDNEEYVADDDTRADFYTCTVGRFRVFVWCGLQQNWLIQIAPANDRELRNQFIDANTVHFRVPLGDALAVKAVIMDRTCYELT